MGAGRVIKSRDSIWQTVTFVYFLRQVLIQHRMAPWCRMKLKIAWTPDPSASTSHVLRSYICVNTVASLMHPLTLVCWVGDTLTTVIRLSITYLYLLSHLVALAHLFFTGNYLQRPGSEMSWRVWHLHHSSFSGLWESNSTTWTSERWESTGSG